MVTIIGGGIAGTVLAGALATSGQPVTLYERQPAIQGGQFLVLDGRAHRALADLGVGLDELHDASHPLTGLCIAYSGEKIRDRPSEGHRLYFRSDLMQVLDEFASQTSAEMHYGTPITSIDPVTATLRSGSTEIDTDGLIIGADGPDSVVRACIEPGRSAEYAGQTVIYGTTTRPVRTAGEPGVLHFQGQLGTGLIAASTFGYFWNDDVAVWFARITGPELPAEHLGVHPVAGWADQILRAAPAIAEIVETMLATTDSVHVINARNVPLESAQPPGEKVVLCGDADHAITPAAGVGARDAIEDAHAIRNAVVVGAAPAEAMAERRSRIIAQREQIEQAYARARS